jgi:hypothetical protein
MEGRRMLHAATELTLGRRTVDRAGPHRDPSISGQCGAAEVPT